MFPYTMIATTPIFFHNDWPRKFLGRCFPKWLYKDQPPQYSPSCLYSKEDIKPEETKNNERTKTASTSSVKNAPVKATLRHKVFTIFAIIYLAEQAFLPYSHFITKGYNNWTNVKSIQRFFDSNRKFSFYFLGFIWLFMGYDGPQLAYVR